MTTETQATFRNGLATLLLTRLGFMWLLAILSLFIPRDAPVSNAFTGIAFVISVPYALWLSARLPREREVLIQQGLDLIVVTGLVYFTGGIHSPLTLLFPLITLSAAITGTRKQAAGTTAAAIGTYTGMALLLSKGLLVEFSPQNAGFDEHELWATVHMRNLTCILSALTGIYISRYCTFKSGCLNDQASTACTLLENMPFPSLLLNQKGRILFCNDAAGELLDSDRKELTGKTYTDLCREPPVALPHEHPNSVYLQKGDNTLVPVSYRSADFELNRALIPGDSPRDPAPVLLTLLTFHDISSQLATERQLTQVERITAATRIAGEMAHEIRTPLTALSASVQLLRKFEEKTTASDWLPNSPRRRDRTELYDHIEDASQRMDDVVTNFINFAQFSPQDLLSIIKLDSSDKNEGYIDHLNTVGRGLQDGQNTDCG